MDGSKVFLTGCVLAAGLIGTCLPGCGRTDLSDYRPVAKTGNSKNSKTSPPESLNTPDSHGTVAQVSNTFEDDLPEVVVDDLPVSALGPLNVIDGSKVSNLLKGTPGETVAETKVVQPASATNTGADKPRSVELLIPDKTFQRDAASKAWRVSYDDLDLLKVLNLEPVTSDAVELMPAWLTELSGQRIRIRGFMYPTFEAEGLERFVLARDNQICCFGRDPKVYDLVQVDLRAGKTTRYIPATRAFDVIGRFKIDLISVDGKPFGLYYVDDAEIIER